MHFGTILVALAFGFLGITQISKPLPLVTAPFLLVEESSHSNDVSTTLFNPPDWIMGIWKNSAESNLDNFESFEFTPNGIIYEKGFMKKGQVVDFSGKYKDYKVSEIIAPELYRIEFHKGKNDIVYEFKWCELETCKTPSTSGALTYSITKNKKIVRSHLTSVQLVLFRAKSAV